MIEEKVFRCIAINLRSEDYRIALGYMCYHSTKLINNKDASK